MRVSISPLGAIAVALAAAALLSGQPRGWAQPGSQQPYYYSDGERIPLTLSTRRVAMRLLPGSDRAVVAASADTLEPSQRTDLAPNRLSLFRLKPGLAVAEVQDRLATFAAMPEVELVALVFEAAGALMIVTDEFVARFSAEMSQNAVEALHRRYGVEPVRPVFGEQNTWVLRVKVGDALETANAYHETPGVEYAHPNFIRLMDVRPAREEVGRGETLILDATGRRLPADTAIEKGASGYRMVAPAAAVLPSPANSQWERETRASVSRATIKGEGFEGAFPNTWTLVGTPTWDTTNERAYAGTWSGYSVGSSISPPGPYPNNASSWMIYGPFSLVDALDARLSLQAWVKTEPDFDYLAVYASTNGTNFYGSRWSGDWAGRSGGSGWMNLALDLKRVSTLGDLRGQPQVWVALRFLSDESVTDEGVYVDAVTVEKITGGYESQTSDVWDHLQWSLSNNGQLWGVDGVDIDAPAAWVYTTGSSATTIAIIDEGVDLAHPDLASKIVPGYDATGLGSGGGPSGDDAHGTSCAGIAAAVTNNDLGVAGVDQQAMIMPIRIAYSGGDGSWVTNDSWIAAGINWAVTNGADVLSNSWGGGSASTLVTNAIANAKSNGRGGLGSLVLFASGNDNGPVSYPAVLNSVLAVGALSPCGQRKAPSSCDGEYWWGSNYGAELDLMAPGVLMYTTDIQGAAGYSSGDYAYNFNGTSSATPAAAGVAALLLGHEPSLTATEAENRLKNTARDLDATGWDQATGWGLVSASQALNSNCTGDLVLNASDNGSASLYRASNSITAGNGFAVAASETVTFEAGTHVRLIGGFSILLGGSLIFRTGAGACN